MTTQKNETTKTSATPDTNRRNMALNLLGLLGGSALLKACATPESNESAEDEGVATALQGLTGAAVRWAYTVFGADGPTDRTAGDLNNPPQGPNPPVVMIVTGANTPGDGGGGVFFWDPTTGIDDKGTVIVPQVNPNNIPGCWRRVYEGPLNVKWFGSHNTEKPIQDAIDSAAANPIPSGGRVYIPPGTYLIETAIEMKTGVELFGAGVSSVLMRDGVVSFGNYDNAVIKALGVSNVRIANLKIHGNKIVGASPVDAYQQSGIALVPAGENPCIDVVVENCIITESVGNGVLLLGAQHCKVFGSSVKNNGANGVVIDNGLNSTVQSSESLSNADVGIHVDGASTFGVHVRDNRTDSVVVTTSQVSITGCRVTNDPSHQREACIVIKPSLSEPNVSPTHVTVTNCHLKTTTYGVKAVGVAVNNPGVGNIINGNIITDILTTTVPNYIPENRHGVWLKYQSDTSIVNNNISGVMNEFVHGIQCEDCHQLSIGSNSIARTVPVSPGVFGVTLVRTSDTTVTGNAIRSFVTGVVEDTSDHNIVSANVLKDNTGAFGAPGTGSIYDHNIV